MNRNADSIATSLLFSLETIGFAMERSSRVSFGRTEQRPARWLRNLSCPCKRFDVSAPGGTSGLASLYEVCLYSIGWRLSGE